MKGARISHRLKEIQDDTSGASLVIALIFALMCALAGSVILSSATVSSGRLIHIRKNEQSYYTVSSAARLLKQQWQHIMYQNIETYTITISEDGVEREGDRTSIDSLRDMDLPNTPEIDKKDDNQLRFFIKDCSIEIKDAIKERSGQLQTKETIYHKTWTIEVDGNEDMFQSVNTQVTVSLISDTTCSITAVLEEGNTVCELTMTGTIVVDSSSASRLAEDGTTIVDVTNTTMIRWGEATIVKR